MELVLYKIQISGVNRFIIVYKSFSDNIRDIIKKAFLVEDENIGEILYKEITKEALMDKKFKVMVEYLCSIFIFKHPITQHWTVKYNEEFGGKLTNIIQETSSRIVFIQKEKINEQVVSLISIYFGLNPKKMQSITYYNTTSNGNVDYSSLLDVLESCNEKIVLVFNAKSLMNSITDISDLYTQINHRRIDAKIISMNNSSEFYNVLIDFASNTITMKKMS